MHWFSHSCSAKEDVLIRGRSGSVSLCPKKSWFLWDGYTLRSPTLQLSTLGFQCFNQQLVDTSFPHGGGGSPMVDVGTQCSEGSTSYSDRTRHSVVHGCFVHHLGTTLECIDGVRCMDNNRKNTSHQHARFGSHKHSHAPLATEAYGPDSPGCISRIWSIQLYRRTKRLLLMCQDNQIVLWAWHIPGRLNILADILSHPTQMSGTEWSLHPSVFWALTREWGIPLLDLFTTRWNHNFHYLRSPFQIHQPWE